MDGGEVVHGCLLKVCPGLSPFPSRGRLNGCWTLVRIILKFKKNPNIISYLIVVLNGFPGFSRCQREGIRTTAGHTSPHNSVCHLLMELTLGTVSLSHTPSASSRSLISQANMVGFCLLYSAILSTTFGVATLGLEPPMTPGLMLPVS